jgi:hypothetical protein
LRCNRWHMFGILVSTFFKKPCFCSREIANLPHQAPLYLVAISLRFSQANKVANRSFYGQYRI